MGDNNSTLRRDGQSSVSANGKHASGSTFTAPLCGVCGKPVQIESAKTDGIGRAIHEDCLVLKMKLEHASKPSA